MAEIGGSGPGPQRHTLRHFVGDAMWGELLALAAERRHGTGSLLLRQGESGTHVLAVVSGVAKVVRREYDGRLALLAFRGPGELLGEVAVLDGGERSASVEAMSHCTVGVVPKDEFLRFVADRDLFPVMVRYALSRLREADQARTSGDLAGRLAATFVGLAEAARVSQPHDDGPVELALTRDELAQHLKISRNTVTVVLAELGDLVRVRRKRILLDDLPALRGRARAAGPPEPQ